MRAFQWLESTPARRRVTVIVSALATLLVADGFIRIGRPTFSAYSARYFKHKMDAVVQRPPPDILLLGSSRTGYALVPDEFAKASGSSVFNLGVPYSQVAEWQIMAQRLLPRLRPRLTIIGVNADEFRADSEPIYAARYLFTFDDLTRCLSEDGWSTPVVGHYVRQKIGPLWAGYDMRLEIKKWTQEQCAGFLPKYAQHAREQRHFMTAPCPFDGYEHPARNGKELFTAAQRLNEDGSIDESLPFSPAARSFVHFDELLSLFEQQHLPVMVVYLPNCPRLESKWNQVEPQAIAVIERVCALHRVPFLPCPQDEVPRTDADYTDERHVGLSLAHRLSRRIAETGVALGMLPPGERRLASATFDEVDR